MPTDPDEMSKTAAPRAWPLAVRLLHWLTVPVLALQVIVTLGPMDQPGMAMMNWLPAHISVGAAILAIVVARLVWRTFSRAPSKRNSRSLEHIKIVFHMALYGLILAVLVTGWLGYRPMPFMPPARLFGGLPMPLAPSMAPLSVRAFAFIHARLAWILFGLIGLHIAAAFVHFAWLRDDIMRGMTVGRGVAGD